MTCTKKQISLLFSRMTEAFTRIGNLEVDILKRLDRVDKALDKIEGKDKPDAIKAKEAAWAALKDKMDKGQPFVGIDLADLRGEYAVVQGRWKDGKLHIESIDRAEPPKSRIMDGCNCRGCRMARKTERETRRAGLAAYVVEELARIPIYGPLLKHGSDKEANKANIARLVKYVLRILENKKD